MIMSLIKKNKTLQQQYTTNKTKKTKTKLFVGGSKKVPVNITANDISEFQQKIASLIPKPKAMTMKSATEFNKPIKIDDKSFTGITFINIPIITIQHLYKYNLYIRLYAFIILYCILVHKFRINISDTNNIILNTIFTILVRHMNINNIDNIDITDDYLYKILNKYFTNCKYTDNNEVLYINIEKSFTYINTQWKLGNKPNALITQISTIEITIPQSIRTVICNPPIQQPLAPIPQTEKQIAKGINNYGNTCYLNAFLQMLWDIKTLRDYFINNSFDIINNLQKTPQTILDKKNLTTLYNNKISTLFESSGIIPKDVVINWVPGIHIIEAEDIDRHNKSINSLSMFFKAYSNNLKQNTNTTNNLTLSSFTRERVEDLINYYKFNKITIGRQEDTTEMQTLFAIFYDYLNNTDMQSVMNSLGVILITNTFCENNIGNFNSDNEYSHRLTLPINLHNNTKENLSVMYLLNKYCEKEKWEVSNGTPSADRSASGCTKYTYTQNKICPININEDNKSSYIIINISRFSFSKTTRTSTKNMINITLDPEISFNSSLFPHIKYVLQGCIVHIGSHFNGGHYIYFRYNESGTAPILLFDDDRVSPYDTKHPYSELINTNAYVLLYRRK